MTCAELLDTLRIHGLLLVIDPQPGKPEVSLQLSNADRTTGDRRLAQGFIPKSRLADFEDQQYKEQQIEQVVDGLLLKLHIDIGANEVQR